MKKDILFFIILIFIGAHLSGQRSKDVLHLKNGSIIYGKLIEIVDDQYKIQTSDGSIFIYKSSEVEKFAKESPIFDVRKVKGIGIALESGFLFGAQNSEFTAPFSFNFLAGITGNTKNITSIGSGVEFFGRAYTPLFIEYKRIIYDRKVSPFFFVRGGAVMPFGGTEKTPSLTYNYNSGPRDYKGGASFTLGTGISWAKQDFETYLSFAYRYAHSSYVQNESNLGDVTYNNSLNRLEIKFGFKF